MSSIAYDEPKKATLWQRIHIDIPLLLGLVCLLVLGLFIVYSASGQEMSRVIAQGKRVVIALVVMLVVAQIPPQVFRKWAVPGFVVGVLMLVGVLMFGHIGKGAQRWLDLGFMRFQPSEIMKLIVPITVAWYISLSLIHI